MPCLIPETRPRLMTIPIVLNNMACPKRKRRLVNQFGRFLYNQASACEIMIPMPKLVNISNIGDRLTPISATAGEEMKIELPRR
jgi:hypothetical protein